MNLKKGIYEQIISDKVNEELEKRKDEIDIKTEEIEREEAKEVLSKHLGDVAKKSLEFIKNLDNKLLIKRSRRRRYKNK